MSLEERIELHDQWLRSIESNQAQFAENLGRASERLDRIAERMDSVAQRMDRMGQDFANYQNVFNEHMTNVAMNLSAFFTALARQSTECEERDRKLEAEDLKLRQGLQELRELIERYIRFRGNGNPPAN